MELLALSLAILSPIRSLNTRPSQLALLAAVLASVGACIDKVGVGSVWPFAYVLWRNSAASFFSS